MTKVIAQTYNSFYENIKTINYILFIACLMLIVMYAFGIFSTVSKTVAMQKIELDTTKLSNSVNNLDSEYLALSGQINPDNLSSFGMTKGQVSEYITRSISSKFGMTNDYNHVALANER